MTKTDIEATPSNMEWILPKTHHIWEIHGVSQVLEMVALMNDISNTAMDRGNAQGALGQNLSAAGAYIMAEKTLETAMSTMKEIEESISEEADPQSETLHNPLAPTRTGPAGLNNEYLRMAELLSATAQRLVQTVNTFQSAPLPITSQQIQQAGPWYAMTHHRIVRQETVRALTQRHQEVESRKRNPDPAERERRLQVIHHMATWPSKDTYSPTDFPVLQEPDPELGAQARSADRLRDDDLRSLLTRYNADMPTTHTPAIAANPNLASRLERTLLPPNGCIAGFEQPDPPADADSDNVLAWTAFVYNGVRHTKMITEPYPHGFPQAIALGHIRQMGPELDDQFEHAGSEMERFERQSLNACVTCEAAATLGIHTLTQKNIDAVTASAAARGLTKGEQAALINRLANGNPYGELFLKTNFPSAMQTTSQDNAQRLIAAARKMGLDERALSQLAAAMGFQPHQAGANPDSPSNQLYHQIARDALDAGLPHQTAAMLIPQLTEIE